MKQLTRAQKELLSSIRNLDDAAICGWLKDAAEDKYEFYLNFVISRGGKKIQVNEKQSRAVVMSLIKSGYLIRVAKSQSGVTVYYKLGNPTEPPAVK
jgi:hypothetical protein